MKHKNCGGYIKVIQVDEKAYIYICNECGDDIESQGEVEDCD